MNRISILCLCIVSFPVFAQSQAPLPYLTDYISKTDGSYSWEIASTENENGNSVALLKLKSQKWQGEVWDHDVQIFLPKGVKPTSTVVLLNTGGKAGPKGSILGFAIAERVKAPVIVLYGVPKQPLYGKREDALIAESFVKYLETRDATWPLLFPMVKSVIKCMDAVQSYAKQEWKHDVTGFIVTGASKRGWTTWLTAATGDKRVKAIAPLVFDSLNLQEQMPHQLKSFGRFSAMIKDYEDRKLLPLPDSDDAKRLWAMVDPWAYREAIVMPKLIVNGANDPYWATDAVSLYWNGLKGPKSLLSVANAGHDLRAMDDPGAANPLREPLPMKAVDTVAVFCRSIIEGTPFASIAIGPSKTGNVKVTFTGLPVAYRLWVAKADNNDFRKSKWLANAPVKVVRDENTYHVDASDKPVAHFLEAEYEIDRRKYYLSTPPLITNN